MKIYQPIAGVFLAALLSACGGGGGDAVVASTPIPTLTYDYAALNGNYTCPASSITLKVKAIFSATELSVGYSVTELGGAVVQTVIYKDKVGFLSGFSYYSKNTQLTENAETFFFFNGKLTVVNGPAVDVPDLLAQRPRSIYGPSSFRVEFACNNA